MAALSGWLALSTQLTIVQNNPFADAGYVRQAVSFAGSPLTNEQPRMIPSPQVEPGRAIRYAVVMDDPIAGYPLRALASTPRIHRNAQRSASTTVLIAREQNILHAINYGEMYGGGVSSSLGEVLRGVPLGRANGQVVWSGVRLVCKIRQARQAWNAGRTAADAGV